MSVILQKEIEKLQKKFLDLSAIVEENVCHSIESIQNGDVKLAEEVILSDADVDQTEVDIEEECLKILALHQPVASDLRLIIAVLKINNDLERVADLAVNIAKRTKHLVGKKQLDFPFDFAAMAEKTCAMLRASLDAFVKRDTEIAYRVCTSDDEVDAINKKMYTQVQNDIPTHLGEVDRYINYLAIARNLERMADYATNIAEDVIYMINGEIIRHRWEGKLSKASG